MENAEKNKKYLKAGFIGFFLILLVALVTIFRSNLSSEDDLAETSPVKIDLDEKNSPLKEKALKAEDLMKKIIQREDLVILDIRSEEEYKKEHLANSRSMPFINFQEAVGSLQKDQTYVVLDDDYAQSAILAINILLENKIANVFYLTGGFSSWKSQYNPTISRGDPNSFIDQSKVKYIKSDKLKELLIQDSQLLIIDVRGAEAFQAGHIKGAINIFLEDLEKEKARIPLSSSKIVLYDNDGLWAFMGAVRLYDMGFFNILTLSDGLEGWKNNKGEVVR